MRPSQTSSARGCSLTCGTISRGCNCLRRWRWVKSKIILKLLVLTNCPSGDSDIILEQQAGAPWSLRVGVRPRIFAVEGKILPAHIFTHPWSHWCGILSAQNRGSEKPITPVPMSDIQHYVSPASELEEGAFLFRDCCGNGRHYRKHVDGSFTLCFVDWLRCMSWNSNWIVAGESVPAGSSPWFHLLPCFLALAGCQQWHMVTHCIVHISHREQVPANVWRQEVPLRRMRHTLDPRAINRESFFCARQNITMFPWLNRWMSISVPKEYPIVRLSLCWEPVLNGTRLMSNERFFH